MFYVVWLDGSGKLFIVGDVWCKFVSVMCGIDLIFVGVLDEVVDQFVEYVWQLMMSGYMINLLISLGMFDDFVELIVFELKKCGLYWMMLVSGIFCLWLGGCDCLLDMVYGVLFWFFVLEVG